MMFRQKIPCYVLVFEQVEIIQRTLKFLSRYANDIDIIVIENPSKASAKIKKIVDTFARQDTIKRHYLFNENVTGNAFGIIIEHEADIIRRHKYVMITDGDIDVASTNWLKEQRNILRRHQDIFACGISLDMSNLPLGTFPDAGGWIPPDINEHRDYFEAYTGIHLLLLRSRGLLGFMEWKKQNNLPFVDGNMHRYCYEVLNMKWARTKRNKAYHITWDLYHDRDHPYTEFKLSKSFQKTWYHQKTSDFTVTSY